MTPTTNQPARDLRSEFVASQPTGYVSHESEAILAGFQFLADAVRESVGSLNDDLTGIRASLSTFEGMAWN